MEVSEIYKECFHPKKVKIFDSFKRTYVEKEVPCGTCYHCLITRVNEWVTRMMLQFMESKHTYFITLTYSKDAPISILKECDAVVHSINKRHLKQLSPLVLNKTHLQKFFKRLRKSTGRKLVYFACGEYGTEYGRPHYHIILFSDVVFQEKEIQDAWSLYGESIGDIDFQDMNTDAINVEHSFKYVCKYLQKRKFYFNKLKTKKYHEQNCKSNYAGIDPDFKFFNQYEKQTSFDGEQVISRDEFYSDYMDKCMYQYKKRFGPFMVCSKSPAIGFGYLQGNLDRFQKQDYTIRELSSEFVFPRYFFRKTKESFCPYKMLSTINGKPNTCSAIPDVASLLVDLQNCITFNEGFLSNSPTYEYITDFGNKRYAVRFSTPKYPDSITLPQKYFCFYDSKNKITYSLAPDLMYNVCDSRKNVLYRVPIDVVVNELKLSYDYMVKNFVLPNYYKGESKRAERLSKILSEYGSYENFENERQKHIASFEKYIDYKQQLYNQRKLLF